VSIETVRVHTRATIFPEQDANVNVAIGWAQKAMADSEADEDMNGRIYEESLTIFKEHQDGEHVGYDASINVVPAKTVELIS